MPARVVRRSHSSTDTITAVRFPLRVITSKDGKETFRMEATSIEKQSLDASLFEPPADYRDIGSMMKGMMPGGMPPGARPPGNG